MNTTYFQAQRAIAKLRIDTQNGLMKGYAKASELKSHNGQRVEQIRSSTPNQQKTSKAPGQTYSPTSHGARRLLFSLGVDHIKTEE